MEQVQSKKQPNDGVVLYDLGSKMQPVYERVFDKDTGKSLVVKTSEFDIDEYIQASNCQTDLAMLRAEMIKTGQLPQIEDEVVDATLFPENIHEVYSAVAQAEKTFNSLPDNVKKIFGNKDAFMTSLINGSYIAKVSAGLNEFYANAGQAQQEKEKEKEKTE